MKFWNEWVFDGTSDGLGRLVAGVAPTIKTRSDAAYWAYHLFRTSWFMGQGATGLLAGGDVENKHSTGVESPHPSLRFCKAQSFERCRISSTVILRMSVLAFTLNVSHAPISVECLFSMTLLPGVLRPRAQQIRRRRRRQSHSPRRWHPSQRLCWCAPDGRGDSSLPPGPGSHHCGRA